MITFVIGGNKSGKSDHAMGLLERCPGPRLFLATGKARDMAFRSQIAAHRQRRDPALPVVEVGRDLPQALLEAKGQYKAVLVDSLDFWLFVCSQDGREDEPVRALLDLLSNWEDTTRLVLVSCEIGFSPLPASREARRFMKSLGRLNQAVAALSDEAFLVAAGLPLALKKADHGRIQAD
ncbi:adenosylcobinamide kinase /adenosylcobinamide-phosphate guanylyltransferase [Humidesulfovibrio mexicanus]|uniref:Adenosylcobinamide kinase n=1 Tax=Humidesulfovibrio mexicanus TaxID=147047 RepID=A0A238YY89_9BACT|nr:bifunctional adenosylcobinamide kinase/adenosylcobinamide-phosphate guanylyltransferase [Humidesulfovibrio mexicanus]SNR75624.1 adenosylcobinamide kinase /adenosylcobinamide-phosphate guanylyltransferase [Humidesulfovibrio mexicanus]